MPSPDVDGYRLLVRHFLHRQLLGVSLEQILKQTEREIEHFAAELRRNGAKINIIKINFSCIIATINCLKTMLPSNQIKTNAFRHNYARDNNIKTITEAIVAKLNVSTI